MRKIFLKVVFPALLVESLQNRIFLKSFQQIRNSLRYLREMKLVNVIKAPLISFHVFAIKSLFHNGLIDSSPLFFLPFPIVLSLLLVTSIHKSTFGLCCWLALCLLYLGERSRKSQTVTAWLHAGAWRMAR